MRCSAAIYVTTGTIGITNTIVASHTLGISNTGGGVTIDLDGNPRPRGGGFDIGAYESPFMGTLKLYLPLIVR